MDVKYESYEPTDIRRFRWIFKSPGFRVFTTKSLRQEPGGRIIIESYVTKDDDISKCPITALTGKISLLDAQGSVVSEIELTWESVEYMPLICLDYSDSDVYTVATCLHGVKLYHR